MMSQAMLLAGGVLCLVWGTAHLVPTRSVVAGFGEIGEANRRVLTMEWMAEGLTLMFLGILVCLVLRDVGSQGAACLVVRASAGMLFALAILSAATGARTPILPMRLCPVVKLTAAGLLMAGTWGW